MLKVTGLLVRAPLRWTGSLAGCTPKTRTLGLVSFTAQAMPPISPPPPMGATNGLNIRLLFQNFQPQRSLPRNDGVIVEGVDQREMGAFDFARPPLHTLRRVSSYRAESPSAP